MQTVDKATYEHHLATILSVLPQVEQYNRDFTVEEGWLGNRLFYCFYARYTDDERYFDVAEKYLDEAITLVNPRTYQKIYPTDSFDAKLASLGRFFLLSTRHQFIDMDVDAFLNDVDLTLGTLMASKVAMGDLDMWSGALSAGHYFYYRLATNESVTDYLEKLVVGIEKAAQTDSDGDYYWRARSLHNRVYFGISHGSAMVISFPAALYEKNILPDTCLHLIERATRFVLKHQRTQTNGLFPVMLMDSVEPKQFSQCYGDLGVGYGLYRASQVLRQDSVRKITDAVLRDCANRTLDYSLTGDASLVYGASGLAAVFDKLNRLNQNPLYEAAAHYWYQQIPRFAFHQNNFGGYACMMPQATGSMKGSFGWGIVGIGISLMKFLKKDLPPLDGFTMLI